MVRKYLHYAVMFALAEMAGRLGLTRLPQERRTLESQIRAARFDDFVRTRV